MSIKFKIIACIAIAAIITGGVLTWRASIYRDGVAAGKEACAKAQREHEKIVGASDARVDKKTPFNADRSTQLEWLRQRAVR